jgi:hypothetical protein
MTNLRGVACIAAGLLCTAGAVDLTRALVSRLETSPVERPPAIEAIHMPLRDVVSEGDLSAAIDANPFHPAREELAGLSLPAPEPIDMQPEVVTDQVMPVLLGTTVGVDGAKALLAWAGDSTSVVSVGWAHGGLAVLAVTRAAVMLSHADSAVTLRLPGHGNH